MPKQRHKTKKLRREIMDNVQTLYTLSAVGFDNSSISSNNSKTKRNICFAILLFIVLPFAFAMSNC